MSEISAIIPWPSQQPVVSQDEKNWIPGLVNIQKAIENGHRNSGFTH
jgi:hypothetical protein